MNFLELAQTTARKCAISGLIVNVASASGELARVVDWVNESWFDIQDASKSWGWMRDDFSFQTVAGQQEYAVAATGALQFSRWHDESFRLQRASLSRQDEQFLLPWDWQTFRDTYLYGVRPQARPTVFTIRPRGSSLLFGDVPDDAYIVTGEYQRRPERMLIVNDSTPDMPDEYHMAIVHKARMKYAAFENAPEVMAEATRDFDTRMAGLYLLHLDAISTGRPLA